jgi:hypothetical protein
MFRNTIKICLIILTAVFFHLAYANPSFDCKKAMIHLNFWIFLQKILKRQHENTFFYIILHFVFLYKNIC